MGYFGLIDIADIFVFFDDVQFVERSWQRRNRIKVPPGKWIWLSVPVVKKFGQKINEVRINNNVDWADRHWKTIKFSYKRAPFFEKYAEYFAEIYERKWEYLVDLDITIIKMICEILGLDTSKFILSSDLNVSGKKTDRLLNVLEKIGADEYVSGPAAKAYIEIEKFKERGIQLYWFEFNHPVYPQLYGDFISHLSVIDLLFNVGDESLEVIRKGERNALKKAF